MTQQENQGEEKLMALLAELGAAYELYEHEACYTVQEADEQQLRLPGLNLKCLLNKDKKTGVFYLLILEGHRKMEARHFKRITGWKETSFAAPDELYEKMKLTAGSVTPFGLINDEKHEIILVLEKSISEAADDELLNFHPCRNTATIGIKKADFIQLIERLGNEIIWEL